MTHAEVYNQIPFVIDRTGQVERTYDIYSRLLEDRIVFLRGPIDEHTADLVVAQMLYLDSKDSEKDIRLYINSPGGHTTAGFAVYDTIQFVRSDVSTICVGLAASMGAVLLAAGTKGKRLALPNAKLMIHQPWGGAQGQASDIKIVAEDILKTREQINKIMSHHTGQTLEKIEKDTDRDFYMSAEESKTYGLIDEVVAARKLAEGE